MPTCASCTGNGLARQERFPRKKGRRAHSAAGRSLHQMDASLWALRPGSWRRSCPSLRSRRGPHLAHQAQQDSGSCELDVAGTAAVGQLAPRSALIRKRPGDPKVGFMLLSTSSGVCRGAFSKVQTADDWTLRRSGKRRCFGTLRLCCPAAARSCRRGF
jgi:hypothetical protein